MYPRHWGARPHPYATNSNAIGSEEAGRRRVAANAEETLGKSLRIPSHAPQYIVPHNSILV